MVTITLPDGSQRQYDNPVTVQDVAASIGKATRPAPHAASASIARVVSVLTRLARYSAEA